MTAARRDDLPQLTDRRRRSHYSWISQGPEISGFVAHVCGLLCVPRDGQRRLLAQCHGLLWLSWGSEDALVPAYDDEVTCQLGIPKSRSEVRDSFTDP